MSSLLARSAALGLLLVLPALPAGATIIPGGNLINQTWTLAGSPYIVQGDVTIPAGAFLTIEAGVDVQFASTDAQSAGIDVSRVEMTVRGTLSVNGTGPAPVWMHAQSGSSPTTWVGIIVDNTATSATLTHLILNHATAGVRTPSTPNVVSLTNVTLDVNNRDLTQLGGAVLMSGRIEAGSFIGNLTIPSPATLALNRLAGVLTLGNFTLASGAAYEAKLSSLASYEKLQVNGTVSLAGTLALDVSTLTASPGNAFVLIDNDDFEAVSGQFAGLTQGAQFVAGGYSFQVSYQGGDGNDVVVTVQDVACDLAVVKSAPAQVQLADGGISYTLTVSNAGPGTAVGVVVVDSLPSGVRYASAVPSQGSCVENANRVTCDLGNIAAAAGASIAITTTFDFDTLEVVNQATASSQTSDANGANNNSSASTRVIFGTTAAEEPPPAIEPSPSLRTIPNPATRTARIFFSAREGSRAEVLIFDVAGRQIRALGATVAGQRGGIIEWDGRDSGGALVGSGVFFYEVKVDGRSIGTKRAVMTR